MHSVLLAPLSLDSPMLFTQDEWLPLGSAISHRETLFPDPALVTGACRVVPTKGVFMTTASALSPAKRKRLLKQFGKAPAGSTHEDLERLLDFLYGLFSYQYSLAELRQLRISDPFDRSEYPRQLTVIELAEWIEALLA
jgi:hypothetical protein